MNTRTSEPSTPKIHQNPSVTAFACKPETSKTVIEEMTEPQSPMQQSILQSPVQQSPVQQSITKSIVTKCDDTKTEDLFDAAASRNDNGSRRDKKGGYSDDDDYIDIPPYLRNQNHAG